MTVAELIEQLKTLPQDAKVAAAFSPNSCDAYIEDAEYACLRTDGDVEIR